MITEAIRQSIAKETEELREYASRRFSLPDPAIVAPPRAGPAEGEATSVGYPILGIEKYLGLCDREEVLAYFPSLSIAHAAARAVCHIRLDRRLRHDILEVDGRRVQLAGPEPDKESVRVHRFLKRFRAATGLETHGVCVLETSFVGGVRAKGLGLSSAVAAAVARAMTEATYGAAAGAEVAPVSRYARWVSGSGARAVAGGLSLWYSYEGIDEQRSTAVKVRDVPLSLLVFPKASRDKTVEAHEAVLRSRFYSEWAKAKPMRIFHLLEEIAEGRTEALGPACEADTNAMHAVLMEAGRFVLDKEALDVMREVARLREQGLQAYYSVDTGSSVFVLCFGAPEPVRERLAPLTSAPGQLVRPPGPEQYAPAREESERLRERAERLVHTGA